MGCCRVCVMALCVFVAGCLSVSPPTFYTEELLQQFGTNGTLHIEQLENLLNALKPNESQSAEKHEKAGNPTNGHGDCTDKSWVDSEYCRKTKCLSSKGIFELYNLSDTAPLSADKLKQICPTLLYQAQNDDTCHEYLKSEPVAKGEKDLAKVWGFGFLFVTIVNLCSLGGILVLPFMSKTFYRWLLMFLVALAVGTLAGSAAFFLIPDAFDMPEHDPSLKYLWKSAVVCVGIYLFFLIERILKMIMEYRMAKSDENPQVEVDLSKLPTSSVNTHREVEVDAKMKIPPQTQQHIHHHYGGAQHSASSAQLVDDDVTIVNGNAGGENGVTPPKTPKVIAPVAWMIIIGDALHNFVDGLSIGAAFTVSTLSGISVSLAVICEEFPHELGDFAILINAGMTKCQALGFNFLSSLSCYIGLVIGISVGERFNASQWIFALAGGMFLYISLVDMMNDVNHAVEEEDFKDKKMKLFLIQNLGLLIGFGLMLILATYSSEIDFEK